MSTGAAGSLLSLLTVLVSVLNVQPSSNIAQKPTVYHKVLLVFEHVLPFLQGHAVVADMKVLSWSETAPYDYFNIATTADDSMCSLLFQCA